MTAQEAIDKYIEVFGGFPYFLLLGASEEQIVTAVERALESGKEIEGENKDADY